MSDRGPKKKPAADAPDIPLVGAGVAPVAGPDEQPADTREGAPERKRKFEKRLSEKSIRALRNTPTGRRRRSID
jgi:hypothetical protein